MSETFPDKIPPIIPDKKYSANIPSKMVTTEIFTPWYFVFLNESLMPVILNFGVLTKEDFLPIYPANTATEL